MEGGISMGDEVVMLVVVVSVFLFVVFVVDVQVIKST